MSIWHFWSDLCNQFPSVVVGSLTSKVFFRATNASDGRFFPLPSLLGVYFIMSRSNRSSHDQIPWTCPLFSGSILHIIGNINTSDERPFFFRQAIPPSGPISRRDLGLISRQNQTVGWRFVRCTYHNVNVNIIQQYWRSYSVSSDKHGYLTHIIATQLS